MSAQLAQALRRLIAELPVRVTNDQQLIHLSAAHIEGIGQACVKALQAIEAAPQQEPAITVTIDDLDLVQDWAESRLPPGTHKLYAAPQQAQAPIDPDGEESRAGFRAFDEAQMARWATPWQVWREAVKWAAPQQGSATE